MLLSLRRWKRILFNPMLTARSGGGIEPGDSTRLTHSIYARAWAPALFEERKSLELIRSAEMSVMSELPGDETLD